MPILAFLVFLAMGLTNLAAVQAGLVHLTGMPVALAVLIAIPVFYVPILGSVAGCVGALIAWHLPLPAAVLLFTWPAVAAALAWGVGRARTRLAGGSAA
ncbi:hypothetical protein [Methylobacterium oryzihabitans]|uniref:Uncharacterized protein n=1 Tax=Methylobacterium oryzihabitans TaxID=2499852 RepID=A0A437P181_9HYPH|nr:hypothetical protein [Methylobacterium oryzihabitans]RVU16012.1 hypothetical protein EOE48_18305 [Methylobacterium oryzihabitans]